MRIYAHSAVKIHHATYLVEEGRLTCWCRWRTWLQSNLLIHQQNKEGLEEGEKRDPVRAGMSGIKSKHVCL